MGREDVLAILDEVLSQAARGRGRAVVLHGPAGIGKSTILRTLEGRAAAHGALTVHGAGVPTSPAFWPWVVLVRDLVAKVPGLVEGPWASALATIDPALFTPSGERALGSDSALRRTWLSRAAVDLVLTARATTPLTVVLDDVQAVDEETAGLLAVAIPELVARGVLFVLGLRTDDGLSDDVVRRLLDGVPREGVVRLGLTNLTADQVGQTIGVLTRADPDPAVTAAVWARSRGNPLFVTELVRLLVSEGRLDPDRVYSALPSEVRDVLRRRLDRLPSATVALLTVVALVGRATDVPLLARVTDTGEDDVVEACESAVMTGLLLDDADAPGCYALSHDLVRQTLVEQVAPARKVRLHARIGRVLQETPSHAPDHIVEVARHLFAAVPVIGAAAALPVVVAAADDALARLALRQAELSLIDVLTLAAQLPSAEERANVEATTRSRLAVTRLYGKGATSIAEDAVLRAALVSDAPLRLDPADPTAWFAAMTAAVAMGAYQRMVDEATRALTPGLPPELEAMVQLELGLGHFELGHLSAARTALETTRRIVSQGGELGALVFALSGPAVQVLLSVMAHFQGDDSRADALMAEAEALADGPQSMVVARFGRAWLDAYRGDPVGASRHAKACAEVGGGYPAYVAMGTMLGGWAAAVQGHPGGVASMDRAFEDYTSDGTLLHVPLFLVLRGEAHACTGDPEGARLLVARSRSVAAVTGEQCLGPRLAAFASGLERGRV